MQTKDRDLIVYGQEVDWKKCGDYQHFDDLSLEQLEKLVTANEIELEDNQNDSPTNGEFLEFMRLYPQVMAHGYIIGPGRDDHRISIEGLKCNSKITQKLQQDFTELCRHADEFTCKSKELYCWYD